MCNLIEFFENKKHQWAFIFSSNFWIRLCQQKQQIMAVKKGLKCYMVQIDKTCVWGSEKPDSRFRYGPMGDNHFSLIVQISKALDTTTVQSTNICSQYID